MKKLLLFLYITKHLHKNASGMKLTTVSSSKNKWTKYLQEQYKFVPYQ